MPEPLPLLICGAGHVVEALYAPALRRTAGFGLAGVVDPRSERRAWATRYLRQPAYGTLDEALAAAPVAAALVAVPPTEQPAMTLALLQHGLATLTEKPGARSRTDADRLIAAAAGRPLRLALSRRFWHRYQQLAARMTSPLTSWLVQVETDPHAWHAVEIAGVDPLTDVIDDLLPHAYDIARHVLGADLSLPAGADWAGRQLRVRFAGPNEGSILIAHGREWRESVEWQTVEGGAGSVSNGGPRARTGAIADRLLRAARRQPSEPVAAVASLLTDFASDIRAGRTNDDLLACATLIEQVTALADPH